MSKDTIIDDNFLSEENKKNIYNTLISSGEFDWHLNLKTNNYLEKTKDTFQFTHAFFMNDQVTSSYYNLAMNLFNDFLIKHNLKCFKIIRAKANLTTKNKEIDHLEPHVDTNIPHRVFLYYVNDSDGATIFYKDPFDPLNPITQLKYAAPRTGQEIKQDYRQQQNPYF